MIHLIERIRATEESGHPVLKREYEKAEKTKKKTAWYYTIKPINERTLAEAEKLYSMIVEHGLNPKKLTEQNIAQIQGEDAARQIYVEKNIRVTFLQKHVVKQYLFYLNEARKHNAYMTKEYLMILVYNETIKEQDYMANRVTVKAK